jgi:hypothetical protein
MIDTSLRARAYSAASAARFAGFLETAKALVELAEECESEVDLATHASGAEAMAWCLAKTPMRGLAR